MTGSRPVLITLLATAVLQVVIWSGSAQGWLTAGRATALHLLVGGVPGIERCFPNALDTD